MTNQAVGGDPANLELPLYGASLGQAFTRFFKRYAKFSGRSSRSEYWWVALVNAVLPAILMALTFTVGSSPAETTTNFGETTSASEPNGFGWVLLGILGLYALAIVIPGIALAVRRLHDGGFSGWLYLLILIPFVGGLVVLVLMLMPSKPEGQRFDAPSAHQGVQGSHGA